MEPTAPLFTAIAGREEEASSLRCCGGWEETQRPPPSTRSTEDSSSCETKFDTITVTNKTPTGLQSSTPMGMLIRSTSSQPNAGTEEEPPRLRSSSSSSSQPSLPRGSNSPAPSSFAFPSLHHFSSATPLNMKYHASGANITPSSALPPLRFPELSPQVNYLMMMDSSIGQTIEQQDRNPQHLLITADDDDTLPLLKKSTCANDGASKELFSQTQLLAAPPPCDMARKEEDEDEMCTNSSMITAAAVIIGAGEGDGKKVSISSFSPAPNQNVTHSHLVLPSSSSFMACRESSALSPCCPYLFDESTSYALPRVEFDDDDDASVILSTNDERTAEANKTATAGAQHTRSGADGAPNERTAATVAAMSNSPQSLLSALVPVVPSAGCVSLASASYVVRPLPLPVSPPPPHVTPSRGLVFSPEDSNQNKQTHKHEEAGEVAGEKEKRKSIGGALAVSLIINGKASSACAVKVVGDALVPISSMPSPSPFHLAKSRVSMQRSTCKGSFLAGHHHLLSPPSGGGSLLQTVSEEEETKDDDDDEEDASDAPTTSATAGTTATAISTALKWGTTAADVALKKKLQEALGELEEKAAQERVRQELNECKVAFSKAVADEMARCRNALSFIQKESIAIGILAADHPNTTNTAGSCSISDENKGKNNNQISVSFDSRNSSGRGTRNNTNTETRQRHETLFTSASPARDEVRTSEISRLNELGNSLLSSFDQTRAKFDRSAQRVSSAANHASQKAKALTRGLFEAETSFSEMLFAIEETDVRRFKQSLASLEDSLGVTAAYRLALEEATLRSTASSPATNMITCNNTSSSSSSLDHSPKVIITTDDRPRDDKAGTNCMCADDEAEDTAEMLVGDSKEAEHNEKDESCGDRNYMCLGADAEAEAGECAAQQKVLSDHHCMATNTGDDTITTTVDKKTSVVRSNKGTPIVIDPIRLLRDYFHQDIVGIEHALREWSVGSGGYGSEAPHYTSIESVLRGLAETRRQILQQFGVLSEATTKLLSSSTVSGAKSSRMKGFPSPIHMGHNNNSSPPAFSSANERGLTSNQSGVGGDADIISNSFFLSSPPPHRKEGVHELGNKATVSTNALKELEDDAVSDFQDLPCALIADSNMTLPASIDPFLARTKVIKRLASELGRSRRERQRAAQGHVYQNVLESFNF